VERDDAAARRDVQSHRDIHFNNGGMTMSERAMPVGLLRDARGVYGIGVSKSFVDAARHRLKHEERLPDALILRPDRFPDRFEDTKPYKAVLQRITGGFRHGMFSYASEERLRQFIHHEALRRAGLCWPPQPGRSDPRWWSHDPKWQAHNRGIYHGLRLNSLQVINRLIGLAHEEAADADAVKAARRFTFNYREHIYRASAQSRRALQVTDTFPVLALALYSDHWRLNEFNFGNVESYKAAEADFAARKKAAADLVERGARLRDVAATMDLTMALRRIKPGAAHVANRFVRTHPDLLHFMPEALPRSRNWLRLVRWADHKVSSDYAEWVARHAAQIPGGLDQVYSRINDLADWVRAGTTTETSGRLPRGTQFMPSMSLKTMTKLSADWHEAVARDMSGPQFAFPVPWYPAAEIDGYEILPIDSSAELYREGAAMHHCAGTYGDAVKHGAIYIYSIRQNGKRLATLELVRTDKGAASNQLRGPCNTQPPKKIVSTVQRWLRAPGAQQDHAQRDRKRNIAALGDDADGVPF
jgi:PcfJ-like protein